MAVIIMICLTIIMLVLFILDVIYSSVPFTIFLCITAFFVFFGWVGVGYFYISRKRLLLFTQKISSLDRLNPKYQTLFVLYEYVYGDENNLEVVKKAMNEVYFFPKRMTKHPEKIRKKTMLNYLVEYYLSLNISKLKVTFIWDYNKNFFTWKWIGLITLIGVMGIGTLIFCQHSIPNGNDVIYTSLYFLFGALTLPFIAKLFGHFM